MKIRYYRDTLKQIARIMTVAAAAALIYSARSAEPVSPSELLEKGIYSQETKGDLDAAIALYQQVVTEAKDASTLAAQAQYRLGVCYYKKKDFAKATATFEKFVKDYPNQTDLVKLANEYLAGAVTLLPAPWTDGEELRLDVKFATGFKIGFASYGISAGETNGQKIWRLASRVFAGAQQISTVQVDAASFKPLHSHWYHSLIGDVDAVYGRGQVELKAKGKDAPTKINFNGVVYDNEEVVQLIRRLPLDTNYSTTIHIISTLANGANIPLKVDVAGIEKLEVPAGTFECFKVELSVRQTFWYSTDAHHYVVKFEANGIAAELAAINHFTLGQPVTYEVPRRGLTVSLPAGWAADSYPGDEPKDPIKTAILDPEGTATSFLFVNSIDNLKPEEQKSLRACAETQLKDGYKTLQDLKVRPDSWKEETVAGQPALSLMADFVENHQNKAAYAVFTFAGTNAVEFLTYAPTADFERVLPKARAVIGTLKSN
jgi:hypothetical protein